MSTRIQSSVIGDWSLVIKCCFLLYINMLKIRDFWEKHEFKVILAVGFVLIAGISFEVGLVQGKKGDSSPLVIEKVAQAQDLGVEGCSLPTPEAQNLTPEAKNTTIGVVDQKAASTTPSTASCAYVGSKNSNKFYPPNCSYAKRIKPENIVCFASAEEAIAQGRTASTGCK